MLEVSASFWKSVYSQPLHYAQAHILLSNLGYLNPVFDMALAQSLGAQARAGKERTPHRALEQEWIAKRWKDSAGWQPSMSRAAVSFVLNRSMDLLNGSREDIYAFTHALMYVTGFNVSPGRLPRRKTVILADAEAALARCLDEQDYDLMR